MGGGCSAKFAEQPWMLYFAARLLQLALPHDPVVFCQHLVGRLHAQARHDMVVGLPLAACGRISIHAPARGATQYDDLAKRLPKFQFTPPHGGRRPAFAWYRVQDLFQFTPPHGGRRILTIQPSTAVTFQFTPPHGGRRTRAGSHDALYHFNSRPRTGGDRKTALF